MTNEIIRTAERMPGLDGGVDPGAQAEELSALPAGGKPTYRKRLIVRALEDAAMGCIDNPEHAGRYGATIAIYDKGIRDDVVFNTGLYKQERAREKEDNTKDDNNDDEQADACRDEQEARAALADALFKYQH